MMTNEQANEMFRQYRKTGDKSVRNKLVENYMYIAEILAKKFAGRGVAVSYTHLTLPTIRLV